jgi:hypothetical protein
MKPKAGLGARSAGKTAAALLLTRLALPSPLSRLTVDLSAYEIGRLLARRERRRRQARVRRVLIGVAFGAAAFAAAHAHREAED